MKARALGTVLLLFVAGCFPDDGRYSRERAGVFVAEVAADNHPSGPLDIRGPAYFRDDFGRLTVGARLLRPDSSGAVQRGDLFLRFSLPPPGAAARELTRFDAAYREARRLSSVSEEASYVGAGRLRFQERGGVLHVAFELRFTKSRGSDAFHPKTLTMRGVLVSLRNVANAYVDLALLGDDLWLDFFDPYDAAYDPDVDYEQWLVDHPADAWWTSAPGYAYGDGYYYGTVDGSGQFVPPPITGDDGWVYEGENGYQGGDDGYDNPNDGGGDYGGGDYGGGDYGGGDYGGGDYGGGDYGGGDYGGGDSGGGDSGD